VYYLCRQAYSLRNKISKGPGKLILRFFGVFLVYPKKKKIKLTKRKGRGERKGK
jgi:hypothetical protein